MRSYYDAHRYRAMTSVVDAMDESDVLDSVVGDATAEVRVALRLTRTASDVEMHFALELERRLPVVGEALAAGVIDARRARVLADRTVHLSVAAARDVVDRVIEAAGGLTTGQLRARVDRLCLEADPDTARDRYHQAVKDRRMVTEATGDGTANLLGLDLPPHRVNALSRRINHLARSLNTNDETRTMDQLRADVFLDLLAGRDLGGAKAVVDVRVDLDTLAALSEHPGELNGYGPVIADIARQAAREQHDAEWRWSLTHPSTGQVLSDGVTRRRPTTADRRTIEARNPTCIFPGCRTPSMDCDLDHRVRYADGGETTVDNLTPLCRHDHRLKHQAGWTYQPLPDGDHQWTSKLGHTYTTSGTPP
jgi:hypothetical protein